MIYPDKTMTDNAFLDNVIYYAKLMALNCTVKDQEEALSYETPESLKARELLIASVEGTSIYEMYPSIPKDIIEKYITLRSNLDIYAESNEALKTHMNSFSLYKRTEIMDKISKAACKVYVDHYEIMTEYLNEIEDTWFADNKNLYDKCKKLSATYEDLYNALPEKTKHRILKTYINNYDDTDLEALAKDLDLFKEYIANRSDSAIDEEILKINNAMRDVFVSHYDIMVMRGYVKNDSTTWRKYIDEVKTYKKCLAGTASYYELYDLFPKDELEIVLNECLGNTVVVTYNLLNSVNMLDGYIKTISQTPKDDAEKLNKAMTAKYIANYSMYMNYEMYMLCIDDLVDYYKLSEYLPYETRKMVINTQVKEITNIQVYAESKNMLNSFLATLPRDECKRIKDAILKDMQEWYPKHHIEKNNYYRALIGLPPMENGVAFEDTLSHTWNQEERSFREFGKRFLNMLPEDLYPGAHWRQNLYEFDSYDMGILNQYGVIDAWIAAAGANINDIRYRYLKYLGDSKLDIYICSKAMEFQLIGVPTIDDTLFKRKFIDKFTVNRDYVIRTVYSDAHKFQSDYYNKFIIIFILMNTIMDLCTDIPEYIINRDVFDSRCVKYLFESFGIPYYSEIPFKYQKAMLKNLNTLIKYKSSTRNMIDICSLFGFSDVRVFGYYLFKQMNVDPHTGEYLFEDASQIDYSLDDLYVRDANGEIVDYTGIRYSRLSTYRHYDEDKYTKQITIQNEDGTSTTKRIIRNDANVYIKDPVSNEYISLKDADYFKKIKADVKPADLKFIKVPVDEQLTEYKNDPDYLVNYDEMVYQDEGNTWDAGEDHWKLRQDILDYEFNAVKSKYISVETVTEMTELSFQVSYFYNLLFDNMYSEDNLTIEIPNIKVGHKFRFMDVVCYLFSLMYLYNGIEDNIMYSPTQILYVKGYNFNSDFDEVLEDENAFQQNHPISNEPLQDYEKYNIFDVNKQIEENNYDYREAFKDFNMRAFNLECDVDALEKWLNVNHQMSLDDFIVDDSLTDYDQVITLKNFFSLHNTYYQKSIFNGTSLYPIGYNQDIKYAFKYLLYDKNIIMDINDNEHTYVVEDESYMEVISTTDKEIYIMDYESYIMIDPTSYAVFYKWIKQPDGSFIKESNIVYIKNPSISDEYKQLFIGEIGIINQFGKYIFAADSYYTLDENDNYIEVTDPKYFRVDPNDNTKKVLNFGQYFVYKEGQWILDPNNCYVKVEKNGKFFYVLASETDKYQNIIISEDDCYVMHSDGHFIPLVDSDYYTDHDGDGNYEYNEEVCYIITDKVTEYYDPSVTPRVYYQKLTDYYNENNYIIYEDQYYVKDSEGNYIPQTELLDPNNCYFDKGGGRYFLVIDYLARYVDYRDPLNLTHILILQPNNDYLKYKLINNIYTPTTDSVRRYIINSDNESIVVLLEGYSYNDTKTFIVVFNKYLDSYDDGLDHPDKYDPELTDGIWDENDWYYREGYEGEHAWYYKEPGSNPTPEVVEKDPVGSGYYLESTSYIGDVELEEGKKYYIAFDFETNFTGRIQIACDADNTVVDSQQRIYEVSKGERIHIAQTFVANTNKKPALKFLIYDYPVNPIEIGDFCIVSNMRFVRAHNEHFIEQDIPSYDRLQELYRVNEMIYKYLTNLMVNCDNIHTYDIYKKIYDSFMISKYNKEAFKIGENKYAKTYTDFLETRDAVLYERLCYFKSLDPDAMHKQIADNIIEVTYAIDDCIDTYSYGYLYSYFPAVSASYIQQYIIKIINFFKSWKVHLLGINTVYKFDDPWENTVKIRECQQLGNRYDHIKSNVFIYGTVKINPLDSTDASGNRYDELFPDIANPIHRFREEYIIRNRVRLMSTTANKLDHIYDTDEGLNLILNDETVKVKIDDNTATITSSKAGFTVENENQLFMESDESEHDVFSIQTIDEINKDSTDIIEWRDLENE